MVPSKKHCGKSKNTTKSTIKFDVYCQKTTNIVKNGNFHFCRISNLSEKNCRFWQYLSKRARIVVSALNSRLKITKSPTTKIKAKIIKKIQNKVSQFRTEYLLHWKLFERLFVRICVKVSFSSLPVSRFFWPPLLVFRA